jgi:hypothetical protein
LEELGVDERIILKCIFKKYDVGGVGWIVLTQKQVVGCCEHDKVSLGTIKCGEFFG